MMKWLENLDLETLAGQIEAACLLEAAARKPGNVHPESSFADLTFDDFVLSARTIAPILASAATLGVGPAIEAAASATRSVVGKNTNLGIILLIAPLASVPANESLETGIEKVLDGSTVADSLAIYRAIGLAQPGGMGSAQDQDLSTVPTLPPRELMRLAADRDSIARQWANGYQEIFNVGLPALLKWQQAGYDRETVIIGTALSWLSHLPDTLIARKLGPDVAQQATDMARNVLESGWPETTESEQLFIDFDHWLRSDGHRRNPGTTADLIAATLFVALRENMYRL